MDLDGCLGGYWAARHESPDLPIIDLLTVSEDADQMPPRRAGGVVRLRRREIAVGTGGDPLDDDVVATSEQVVRHVDLGRIARVQFFFAPAVRIEHGVVMDFSRPGKPSDNAMIDSFNGSFRDECLNVNWFLSIEDARERIEQWRVDYNEFRPHSSLDGLTPRAFAEQFSNNSKGQESLLLTGTDFG